MNKQYKKDFIKAGEIAREVRAFGRNLIKPGASYNQVVDQINAKITSLGAIPAFPPQIALNDVAAHYLPDPEEDIAFSNEVIKLDIGVCYNGAIGDCATTVDLSGKHQGLVDAAEAALAEVEKNIKVGISLGEIGRIIENTIMARGYKPVRNLSGHGLGKYIIHTNPIIPNYDNGSAIQLKPGMTFAIEPFATTGAGMIYETDHPAIFSLVAQRPVENDLARELLARIKKFNGLPFAIHNLLGDLTLIEVKMGLGELLNKGIIYGYGPLLEKEKGMVAQAENSFLIDEKGNVLVTTR